MKNFPDTKFETLPWQIGCECGKLYVCERKLYWDTESKKSAEERIYIGRVVGGVYYSMDDYCRLFKLDGTLRSVERPKNHLYHHKIQPKETAVADTSKAAESAAPAAGASEDVFEAKPETNNDLYPLETRRIGGTAFFVEVAKQTGHWEDFSKTWGETAFSDACSLACHWLTTAHNATYLFKSWSANYALLSRDPSTDMKSPSFSKLLPPAKARRSHSSVHGWPECPRMRSTHTTQQILRQRHVKFPTVSTAQLRKAAIVGRSA